MEPVLVLGIIAATLALFIYLFWPTVKKLVLNSIVGILLIVLLNLVFGLNIPLENPYIIVPVALFGLPAVGTILILHFGGMI